MSSAWATPVWFFFHGMAEKVHENFYNANRGACLGIVKSICSVLPCPICRKEAEKYISRITVSQVPTKESFKKMIFTFHNAVNRRLHKRIMPESGLRRYKYLKFIKCTRLMCYQMKRFNRGVFRSHLTASTNRYIDLIENSVRAHIQHFL